MNKVQMKVGARFIVEADGDGEPKVVFRKLAELAAIFASGDKCGCCQSTNVIPQVREPQGYTYYEFQCRDCNAQLTFGQYKEGGGLFLKTTDDNGNVKPDGGWKVYQGNAQGNSAPPQQRQQGRPPQNQQRQQQPAKSQYHEGDEPIPY